MPQTSYKNRNLVLSWLIGYWQRFLPEDWRRSAVANAGKNIGSVNLQGPATKNYGAVAKDRGEDQQRNVEIEFPASCVDTARAEAAKVEQRMKTHRRLGTSLFLAAGVLSVFFTFVTVQRPQMLSSSFLFARFGCLMVVLGIGRFFYSQHRIDSEEYRQLIYIVMEQEGGMNLVNGEHTTANEMAKAQENSEVQIVDLLKKVVEMFPNDNLMKRS